MSAFIERRNQDIQKLFELCGQSDGRIEVARVSGNPPNEVEVGIRLRTAPSNQYPISVQNLTKVLISLPSRYPFQEPTATIKTPIFHPNVYSSGKICFGTKWLPSQGLDLLVRRIVQIITFDPTILNGQSPANGTALSWYRDAVRRHAGAFPTDTLTLSASATPKKMAWSDVRGESEERTTVQCPSCRGSLSLPKGKSGRVRCPKCSTAFEAET
ncbi:zinc finger domain-containing protein [Skermanella pratensis]|uniref:zinc finger domain-containing protein n=1 Tax=Skermanella pratensis TaxID=2233999 RepID=UPI001300FB54